MESLAVTLRQSTKTSPLGADKQLRHIRHGKEVSNFRNESDLLCYWPQEGPSSFASSRHYPESNADFGINWLFPVASTCRYNNTLYRQPIPPRGNGQFSGGSIIYSNGRLINLFGTSKMFVCSFDDMDRRTDMTCLVESGFRVHFTE